MTCLAHSLRTWCQSCTDLDSMSRLIAVGVFFPPRLIAPIAEEDGLTPRFRGGLESQVVVDAGRP
jgi:hypothetical protein